MTEVTACGRPVPYVSAWSTELTPPPRLIHSARGIAYADEVIGDRDQHGILWKRAPLAHGTGTPMFGTVHPARQRRAMRKLLCQVCAGPADSNGDGVLWVLKDHRTDWPDWPNRMGVTEPPICEPCLAVATRLCPALRRGYAVFRTKSAPIAGVHGALYGPVNGVLRALSPIIVSLGDFRLPWILASHVVRELREATVIN